MFDYYSFQIILQILTAETKYLLNPSTKLHHADKDYTHKRIKKDISLEAYFLFIGKYYCTL